MSEPTDDTLELRLRLSVMAKEAGLYTVMDSRLRRHIWIASVDEDLLRFAQRVAEDCALIVDERYSASPTMRAMDACDIDDAIRSRYGLAK